MQVLSDLHSWRSKHADGPHRPNAGPSRVNSIAWYYIRHTDGNDSMPNMGSSCGTQHVDPSNEKLQCASDIAKLVLPRDRSRNSQFAIHACSWNNVTSTYMNSDSRSKNEFHAHVVRADITCSTSLHIDCCSFLQRLLPQKSLEPR